MPDIDQVVREYKAQIGGTIAPSIDVPPGVTISREVPTRAPSVGSDVAVPFLVALVSALITFLSVGAIALAGGWPVAVPLVPAGLIMGLVWFLHLFRMEDKRLVLNWDRLLWAVEDMTGLDVNRDKVIGEPSEPWRIILERDTGGELWLNFSSDEMREKARITAAFVQNGTPFSEAALTGTNRPLSRSEFQTLRDLFMFHGLLKWKDPNHHTLGMDWTPPGRSMIRKLAGLDTTTPPRTRTPRPAGVLREGEQWGSEDA